MFSSCVIIQNPEAWLTKSHGTDLDHRSVRNVSGLGMTHPRNCVTGKTEEVSGAPYRV